jgi:hypothetical protein
MHNSLFSSSMSRTNTFIKKDVDQPPWFRVTDAQPHASTGEGERAVTQRPLLGSKLCRMPSTRRPKGKAHLDTDQEASCAIDICHGRQREHVPEGLAALLVVEDAHGRLAALVDGITNLGDGLGVGFRTLHDNGLPLEHVHKMGEQERVTACL